MDEVVIAAPYCISEDLLKHLYAYIFEHYHAVPVIIYNLCSYNLWILINITVYNDNLISD